MVVGTEPGCSLCITNGDLATRCETHFDHVLIQQLFEHMKSIQNPTLSVMQTEHVLRLCLSIDVWRGGWLFAPLLSQVGKES